MSGNHAMLAIAIVVGLVICIAMGTKLIACSAGAVHGIIACGNPRGCP